MAVSLKHSKVSSIPDGADTSLVRPSDWNAEHVLSQDSGRLLGRTTAGTGATEEISVTSPLTLSSGALGITPTFSDAAFSLTDDVDPTKVAQFQLSGITTATTRTYTLPNTSSTLAVTGNVTQTFSGTTTFSAATVTVGSSTAAATYGLGTGATISGSTKAINIGTAGVSGSTTTINIGTAVSGAVNTISLNGTGAVKVPVGTTAERPTGTTGDFRFNSTLSQFEGYNGTAWGAIGGGGVTTSDTPPASPADGDLWWDSADGQMYVYYDDGTSQQWVVANSFAGGTAYLPITGGTVTGATVIDTNSASAALRITQTGSGNALVVEDSANPDATPFVVTAAGDVGIGTSSPGARLQSSGAAQTTTPTGGSATGSGLYVTSTDTAYGMMFGNAASGNGWIQQQRSDGTNAQYNLSLQPIGGNVGIGTTSPSANGRLDVVPSSGTVTEGVVSGTTARSATGGTDHRNGFFLRRRDGTEITNNGLYTSSDTSGANYWENVILGAGGGGGNIVFKTGGNTERGRFDTSGNFQFNSGYGSVATGFGCRAWVSFNGGNGNTAGVIQGSGNVSSITVNATGQFTVNFTSAMPDTNYSVVVVPGQGSFAAQDTFGYSAVKATGTVQAGVKWTGNTGAATPYVSVAVFR